MPFGMMWRNMMRVLDAPTARSASTKSWLRNDADRFLDPGFGFVFFLSLPFFFRRIVPRDGAFGDCDDAEHFPSSHAKFQRFRNHIHRVGDLGNEDDIGPRCNAGPEGQPPRVVSHDVDHHDPVVA